MKSSECEGELKSAMEEKQRKPQFVPAKDDTKPVLRDPILRSDPIESEEAVLQLPAFPSIGFKLEPK
ncbi:hypothetical protein Sjap_012702 [Stephania japonica]|uniref:Uncharacterized protein n=1 Tax=Stephania japonica TaxID=461633 RepID=A0AAP0NZ67_9MAGN